jgi:hypothetical protein
MHLEHRRFHLQVLKHKEFRLFARFSHVHSERRVPGFTRIQVKQRWEEFRKTNKEQNELLKKLTRNLR